MKKSFSKRIYTWPLFSRDTSYLIDNSQVIRNAFRSGRVSKSFIEKIMLVVTGVNGCRYCTYGHSRAALAEGVSPEEMANLLRGELEGVPEYEAAALLFAQHFAESHCSPDTEAYERLLDTYGEDVTQDIMIFLRMITVGNLFGNTFDAVISRFSGKPARDSSMMSELKVLLGGIFCLPIKMLLHGVKKKAPVCA